MKGGYLTGAVLLVWLGITAGQFVSPLFLPSPAAVAIALYKGFATGQLFHDTAATATRWIVGFIAGSAMGVALGVAMGLSPRWYRQCELPMEFLRAVPIVSVLPLFLVFFGIGNGSKIVAAGWAALLYSYVNATYGVRSVRGSRIDMARCYRANASQRLRYVILPDSLPSILAGLRVAVSMSLVVVVATEMLLGTSFGLGRRIFDSITIYQMATAYAAIIVSGVLGYLANKIGVLLERHFVYWQGR